MTSLPGLWDALRMPDAQPRQLTEVRHVNGEGPTCGCGGRSSLHVIAPAGDYYLCATCSVAAVESYLRAKGQDDQGPPPTGYYFTLMEREHQYHREPMRWCPSCEIADA